MKFPSDEKVESLSDLLLQSWMPRPHGGRPIHYTTASRWAARGVAGVRLEVLFIGGAICSTRQAIERFFAAVANARINRGKATAKDRDRNTSRDTTRSVSRSNATRTKRRRKATAA